jgi:hypothetical protein
LSNRTVVADAEDTSIATPTKAKTTTLVRILNLLLDGKQPTYWSDEVTPLKQNETS